MWYNKKGFVWLAKIICWIPLYLKLMGTQQDSYCLEAQSEFYFLYGFTSIRKKRNCSARNMKMHSIDKNKLM